MLPSPGKLHSIIHQIHHHLYQTVTVRLYDTFGRPAVIADTDAGLFIPQPERIFEFDKQAVHIYRGVVELHRSGFDLRKVEHIADKLQQECVVVFMMLIYSCFSSEIPPSADTSSEEKPTMALRECVFRG